MQYEPMRPKSRAQKALLSATDGFCARIAQANAADNHAAIFIRLLTEALESDRRIRSAWQVPGSNGSAELFARSIRTDFRDALHQIEPLDCVRLTTQFPQSGRD